MNSNYDPKARLLSFLQSERDNLAGTYHPGMTSAISLDLAKERLSTLSGYIRFLSDNGSPESFDIGDRVTLPGAAKILTVVGGTGMMVDVVWFNDAGEIQKATLPDKSLRKSE